MSNELMLTVPLRYAYNRASTERAKNAISGLRMQVYKHVGFKNREKEIRISEEVNKYIWSRSMRHPPRKLKIKLIIDDTRIFVLLPSEDASNIGVRKTGKEDKSNDKNKGKSKNESKGKDKEDKRGNKNPDDETLKK